MIKRIINLLTYTSLLFTVNLFDHQAAAINSYHPTISEIIDHFKLSAYPIINSGYSGLIYKSNINIKKNYLPKGFKAKNYTLFSSIYYLLPENGKLKFHATKATKQFHYYIGEPILIIVIEPNGKLNKIILGNNLLGKEQLQLIVHENSYVAAKVYSTNNHQINKLKNINNKFYNNNIYKNNIKDNNLKYSMIGCTTIPSWEIEDCIRPTYKELIKKFPQHKQIIAEFT